MFKMNLLSFLNYNFLHINTLIFMKIISHNSSHKKYIFKCRLMSILYIIHIFRFFFYIGHAETAHNRIASVVLGFKEALLEEAEKKKDKRK